MSSKRLSPKEIKQDIREDEVRTFLTRAVEHLQDNPKQVIGAIAGVVGLILLVAGGLSYRDHQRDAANEMLAGALKLYQAPVLTEDANPDDPRDPSFASDEDRIARSRAAFEEVQSSFGSNIAGEVAGLYLAEIEASEGQTESARATWESFLDDHGEHILAVSVRLNLIRLDRAEGRGAQVAEVLQGELDKAEKSLPEDVILFELAQTREEMGETEEAMELYQRIIDEFPQSPYVARARQLTTSAG